MNNLVKLLICVILGGLVFFLQPPVGVEVQAMHMLGIFVFTIIGLILKPLPMGTVSIIGLTLVLLTKTLPFAPAFSGFSNPVVWLIVAAVLISKGFVKTGLGERIAYHLMKALGKTSLGMGYGIVATDLILAPAIPSITARAGGIIYPIILSLSKAFGSEPHAHPRKIGAFLMQTAFQGTVISSAMFLTSMAGNPLAADLAREVGVNITWAGWAMAAIVPGLISLTVLPLVMYKFYPPEIKETPDARGFAARELKRLGPMKANEMILFGVFVVMIGLWISGPFIQMKAVTAALIGLSFLLLGKVLSWDEVISSKGAWDTLVWFATLVMMASSLNKMGLMKWFSGFVVTHVSHMHWIGGMLTLLIIFFYSHYFFASNIAHIGAMYPPFLIVAISLGTPPMLAALTLGFFGNLFGGLTHYGCGPAPIIYGAGYVKIGKWWQLGFLFSVINIIIWLGLGSIWWKLIGLY
ncbi:MAG: putative malate transporter YflS [Chlamydiia bacterium]|nr:putative malate transporter YflS [Chlamydiia bacterium]MCH9615623.1 putative malate transporter YflS [Chlamydiia bacterium]MCH9628974.1 putative malate transporter YflS [Chlamydiia bacterium]